MKISKRIKTSGLVLLGGCFMLLGVSCGTKSPHNGRLPFSLADKAPKSSGRGGMKIAIEHQQADGEPGRELLAAIRPGDVIAFHMSHKEAWSHLRKGTIQKIPYELFRYGHIALVVPDPRKARPSGDLRLLQIAMKQAVNAEHGLDYLKDKSWLVYRAPAGSVDVGRLHEFAVRSTANASDPKEAYDYKGVLGIRNAPCAPETQEEIGEKFSCATLVVAGLYYAGYPLDALHRGGRFDVVTPRQVVESGRKIED